ncbi:hypothetical protein Rmf_42610 [Roseomonas fluvialis]|uniref:Uncharacterized protein n=1 Tax=Roseomonas fluvialis TaxID=1750527 RepID=A0ABN6P6L8_9PROT|nr:hypothetical protein Rmf_42610 [Roseomonas fluvialis]
MTRSGWKGRPSCWHKSLSADGRVVTSAVDRKTHEVGASVPARQQRRALLRIEVQHCGAEPLGYTSQLRGSAGTTADMENRGVARRRGSASLW